MVEPTTVAVIGGDGIGPEVVEAAIPVIDAATEETGPTITWERLPYGAEHFLSTGETLPDSAFEHLRDDVHAIFVGALGDPRVPDNEHARDILLGLRFRLDLYINFRPCVLLDPILCPLKPASNGGRPIDFAVFRENTEGLYLGRGSSAHVGTEQEEHIAEEVHTAAKVKRIIRAAFDWAQRTGRGQVTVCDKSNAIPAHRMWRRLAADVAESFPDIDLEFRYADALVMEMVREPERFQVIVANNLLGDILSDLGAQLVGGLGVAASANLHPGRVGLFEPVHGSAPPLARTGQANPLAAMLTGALLLRTLGAERSARRIERAVRASLVGGIRTPDLAGSATTTEVSEWITGEIARSADRAG